jgi:alkylation response protein AidB-like acyl-CoA dehydrogenase
MNELLTLTKKFVKEKVVDRAIEHDKADSYPTDIVNEMKELGFFGLTISEEYGGLGIDKLTYVEIVEELAKGWASVPGLLNSHLIVAYLIEHFGNNEQKGYLPSLAEGSLRGAILLTEPGAGSDLKSIQCQIKNGKLSGQKTMITNGREAGLFAVLAKENGNISIYIIESDKKGITIGSNMEKMGFKGIETVDVYFDEVEIEKSSLLGIEGKGISIFLKALEFGRLSIAASALGVAQAAYEYSLRYAQERSAYGNPIAELQTVQLHLAKMYTKITATRLLTHQSATSSENLDLSTSVAKYFASETAVEVTNTALRIFGGYGYMKEYPIERYIRDATMYLVGEGANDSLLTSIAKKLVRT